MSVNNILEYPLRINGENVEKKWLDKNGHMNVAAYIASASDASFELIKELGVDDKYRQQKKDSFFTLETQIRYIQEIKENATLSFEARIVDANGKLFHTIWLHYAKKYNEIKYLAAVSEWIYAYVDLESRKVKPYPQHIAEKINANKIACSKLKPVERQGQPLLIRKK